MIKLCQDQQKPEQKRSLSKLIYMKPKYIGSFLPFKRNFTKLKTSTEYIRRKKNITLLTLSSNVRLCVLGFGGGGDGGGRENVSETDGQAPVFSFFLFVVQRAHARPF